jgi:transcriptional regulator with XRE-family HTH domain
MKNQSKITDNVELGQKLLALRKRCGFSIRRLAERSGVTAGMISCMERGKHSPSIMTLQKVLAALGTSVPLFFGGRGEQQDGPVFPRERMRLVSKTDGSYTTIFPDRADIRVVAFDQHMYAAHRRMEYDTIGNDEAAYVLSGDMVLEVKGEPERVLRPGDAFYLTKGTKVRIRTAGDEPVRLITMYPR